VQIRSAFPHPASSDTSPVPKGLPRWIVTRAGALALLLVPASDLALGEKSQPARGKSKDQQPAPTGALVIVGGGRLPEVVRDRYLELAGGKKSRIVVIPTASASAQNSGVSKSLEYWKRTAAESVTLLHTLDTNKADDESFVKPLTEATGVWLGGGDQSRLTGAYRKTAVERELRKVLERGGVIGGTSAGASAMSALMIASGNPEARTDTGFGLLGGVIIDQHFHNRNRLKRLQGVLTKHNDYVGLGIDEETAVVVKGQTATVLGNANVRVCVPPVAQKLPSVQVLKSGQEIDLNTLRQAILKGQK
jgi:cyanophycinase